MPWHLDLGWAGSPSGQALWVGGLVPIGNGLDIINPANHSLSPVERRVQPRATALPGSSGFLILLPLNGTGDVLGSAAD